MASRRAPRQGPSQLLGNRYWSEELSAALAGRPAAERKVIVRCDPERLDRPVRVETPDGRLIGCAQPQGSVPVLSAEQARETARDTARAKKLTRQQVALQLRMDEREATAALDEAARIAEERLTSRSRQRLRWSPGPSGSTLPDRSR